MREYRCDICHEKTSEEDLNELAEDIRLDSIREVCITCMNKIRMKLQALRGAAMARVHKEMRNNIAGMAITVGMAPPPKPHNDDLMDLAEQDNRECRS